MRQYQDMLFRVMDEGVWQKNRTSFDAKFIPGAYMEFDLRKGFPAVTTRKVPFRSSLGETIGFLRGVQSAAEFRKLGCKFWDSDANENAVWLASPWRKGEDDIGICYGSTWRSREVTLKARSEAEAQALEAEGFVFETEAGDVSYHTKKIDQLRECVDTIINRPLDRRIIMHAWFPELFPMMALPPCHVLYEFMPDVENNVLHCGFFQRSTDSYLGSPANAIGASLILSIISKACGYEPGVVSYHLCNVHAYRNEVDNIQTQLDREPLPLAELDIKAEPEGNSVDDAMRFIETLEPSDVELKGYQHHPALPRVEMAQEKVKTPVSE